MLDDLHQLRARARRAVDQGRPREAEGALLLALTETHVAEHDYVSILTPLSDLLYARGDVRGALTVHWYLAAKNPAHWAECAPVLAAAPPADRGRSLAAMGKLLEAARELEDAGKVAAAAIYRETAQDWSGARALWSRLAHAALSGGAASKDSRPSALAAAGAGGGRGSSLTSGTDAYIAALIQCNLARSAHHSAESRQSHDAMVLAVRLLEEAADHFESVGLRERAFDCFQVLIQLGREHETFEDVLEGFVNCIRILREDHLKYFALQYLDDAIALAREQNEFSAAATLALEASQYARAIGLGPSSAHYVMLQAELWRDAARQHLGRGDAPEIAENALLAAVVAFAEVGQHGRVGALYTELALLELPDSRRAHYTRAAGRYDGAKNELTPSLARPLRAQKDAAFAQVWHADVLEWEQAGSAVDCCGDILLDPTWPDLIRRRALIGRLTALEVEGMPAEGTLERTSARIRLADQLAQLQLYVVLSPLERLWATPDRAVRVAVLSALQRLFFKRSFVTVRAGLADPDPGVADHARVAMESLYFAHAFDPLSRVVRESTSPRVRASAIKALARVDTTEAAEFLLGILEHGAPADRDAAVQGLRDARGTSFLALATQQLNTQSASNAALRNVLRHAMGDP